jgi:hypothetical protein
VSFKLKYVLPVAILFPLVANALPVDWHGSFGVDSTMITDYRKITSKANVSNGNDGSQETTLADGNKSDASFQTYILRLAPDVIINDTATFKSEFTTGYASGGFLGDAPANTQVDSTKGTAQTYYYNQANGKNLNLKKAYVELNADTATWLIGRHTIDSWGLGAMFSDGKDENQRDSWNRFAYSRDGVTAKFKFNNFYVTPFWTQSSNTGLTRSTDAKEFGSSFLYDNKEKEIAFGLYYSKKSSNAFNTFYKSNVGAALINQGDTSVKVTDLYLKKIFGKFNVAVEVPLLSGELGHVYDATTYSSLSAKAILVQTNYQHNDFWNFGIDVGDVSGNDGSTSKFSASYLNPNFQVANLLFKYNVAAIGAGSTESVFDSNITNTQYLKARATYSSEKWILDFAFIKAKAKEVAKTGVMSFNHSKNKFFTAAANQADDLGSEFDFGTKYKWNKEISIGTSLGYLMAGDYFAFSNTATPNSTKNSLMLQINTLVTF